jgi:hypothetical protein
MLTAAPPGPSTLSLAEFLVQQGVRARARRFDNTSLNIELAFPGSHLALQATIPAGSIYRGTET